MYSLRSMYHGHSYSNFNIWYDTFNLQLRYSKIYICMFLVTMQIKGNAKKWRIFSIKRLENIRLTAFSWKFYQIYQICDHRFKDFLAITEIHLHRNNIGFNICGLSRCWNKLHHWKSSLAGNLKLLNETCAFRRLKVNYNFFNQA